MLATRLPHYPYTVFCSHVTQGTYRGTRRRSLAGSDGARDIDRRTMDEFEGREAESDLRSSGNRAVQVVDNQQTQVGWLAAVDETWHI